MKWKKICAIIFAATFLSSTAFSAKDDSAPSEVKADEIDYDMNTGIVTATGKVFMRHKEEAPNAESNVPSEVNADNVNYDMNTGIVTATGNVLLKHGTGRATGQQAMYNVNTQEAYLTGNVIVTREDLKITCDNLRNDGYGHMQADGNVYGVQTIKPNAKYPKGDTRTFKGDHVDYYPDDRKHVVIPSGGIVTSNDGNFTADYMEGWIDEEYYVGTGNVHVVSPPKNLEGGGDRIDYYAGENGKAVLSGNAWAIQKNNTMRGNRLTVYLADDQKDSVKIVPSSNSLPHENLLDAPFKN